MGWCWFGVRWVNADAGFKVISDPLDASTEEIVSQSTFPMTHYTIFSVVTVPNNFKFVFASTL